MISGIDNVWILNDMSSPTSVSQINKRYTPQFPVISCNKECKYKLGWLSAVIPTGVSSVIQVTLDDGSIINTDPDQEYMLRDGNYCRAKDLEINQSLMPIYIGRSEKDYVSYSNRKSTNKANPRLARVVAESINGKPFKKYTHVSFKDKNRFNLHPDNLQIKEPDKIIESTRVPAFVKVLKEVRLEIEELQRELGNHKIAGITKENGYPLYACLSTDTENFSVSGIFLKTMRDD